MMEPYLPLLSEITEFLVSCGGVYTKGPTPQMQGDILECLVYNQYLLDRDSSGKIIFFQNYYKIDYHDIELVVNRLSPLEKLTGSIIYVVDCGSIDKHSMLKAIDYYHNYEKKCTGVLWCHQQEKWKYFKIGGR